jgi:hypothetical protein
MESRPFTVLTLRRSSRISLLALFVVTSLLLSACGLGAEDIPFNVKITNDTSHTVVDWADEYANYSVVLTPGHSFLESEYTNEGVRPDRIELVSGQTLGCLPFQFTNTPPTTLDVRVSQMVPCKGWVVGSTTRQDWPDPKF